MKDAARGAGDTMATVIVSAVMLANAITTKSHVPDELLNRRIELLVETVRNLKLRARLPDVGEATVLDPLVRAMLRSMPQDNPAAIRLLLARALKEEA